MRYDLADYARTHPKFLDPCPALLDPEQLELRLDFYRGITLELPRDPGDLSLSARRPYYRMPLA